jgi:hypothetical protein
VNVNLSRTFDGTLHGLRAVMIEWVESGVPDRAQISFDRPWEGDPTVRVSWGTRGPLPSGLRKEPADA